MRCSDLVVTLVASAMGWGVTAWAGPATQAADTRPADTQPAPNLVVAAHNWLKPMDVTAAPPARLRKEIRLRVTPGEYEPASFAVRADAAATVMVTLEQARAEGDPLPASWCEVHRVDSLRDETMPNRLMEIPAAVSLRPNRTQFFWLTVRPPEGTAAGTYRGHMLVKAGAHEHALDIVCEVLPFRLADSPIVGGVFMAGTDLPAGWYRDMKEHNIDAIQMFWNSTGIDMKRDGERLVLGFADMDRYMAEVGQAGMKGPVIISLGNDNSAHYERDIARLFGMEVKQGPNVGGKTVKAPDVSPPLDRLFADGLRQIREHWKAKDYAQELVVLIYDEPTERLLERHKNRYDLLKTVMPDTRVYGVVMNRRAWAESMADQCDIIVADGDFLGCLEVARKYNKGYWVYSFPLANVHTARYDMGALPWRVEAQGAFFWMYNYWGYDADACAVYRHPDDPNRLVRSTPWEAVREGLDDLRYVATAERLIAKAPKDKQAAAKARLANLRLSIEPSRRKPVPRGEAGDETSVLEQFNEPQRIRDELIRIILDLR